MPETPVAPRFPYVLFDLGSTLMYFEEDWSVVMPVALQAATQTLRSLGYDLDGKAFPEAYNALMQAYYQRREDTLIEYTARQILEEALQAHSIPRLPEDHLRQALKVLYGVTQAHWRREQDALPTLDALRAGGCRMGIISNAADDDDVQVLVDNSGLRPYFDFVLTSARLGVRKPSPQIFNEALSFWGARPAQAVMVGDTVAADVAGANALGIASIWITRRNDTPENRADALIYPPALTVAALSEIPGFVL